MKENKLNIPEVRLRDGFSERNNIETQNRILQTNDLDNRTRMKILDEIKFTINFLLNHYSKQYYTREEISKTFLLSDFFRLILREVYIVEINYDIEYDYNWILKNYIKPTILYDTFNHVFDLIEIFYNTITERIIKNEGFYTCFNKLLTSEYVGYRFINGKLLPITNETEIQEVQQAIKENQYNTVNKHLTKAVTIFSNRENPDYENVIKESILAVEALCQIITKNDTATLGEALKKIEDKGIVIHGALKSSFNILYGYTSDSSGIRHANGIGEKDSTFAEAKFMLVSCCAFINYLTEQISHISTKDK